MMNNFLLADEFIGKSDDELLKAAESGLWPIDCMEAHNILAYNVYVRRPIFFIVFSRAVGAVTQTRNIVRQRVQPDVNDVSFVKLYGHAPFEREASGRRVSL